MKVYVLMISKKFPKWHRRRGKETGFIDSILSGKKVHTIREDYIKWLRRARDINRGNAVLSVRYWEGKPYHSKQIEILRLTKIKVQKVIINYDYIKVNNRHFLLPRIVAHNDGLKLQDFTEYFKNGYGKEFALIQFTDFHY